MQSLRKELQFYPRWGCEHNLVMHTCTHKYKIYIEIRREQGLERDQGVGESTSHMHTYAHTHTCTHMRTLTMDFPSNEMDYQVLIV
jgi:hypothetical protein